MAKDYTKVLLITANVGSIFEDPHKMLQIWISEFLATVRRLDPDFLAVHCQEVGGKNYEESMQHVNQFIKTLLASEEMQQFDKARVFLDEDFTAVDKFTALGCMYFIHQSVQNAQIWDFKDHTFVPVHGREVLSGNIENVTIKEKAKFPQEFFPDFKWSRKGFLRTRWNLCNSVFDLVNIHLFHDASNIVAMEKSPSIYCGNRCKAFKHTLERLENDQYEKVPCFYFGDFNFRLDTHALVKRLAQEAYSRVGVSKKNDVSKIEYCSTTSGEAILTIEKKGFDHHLQHNEVFANNNNTWLHDYDTEPLNYKERLYEFPITFPPSYPFSEDVDDGTSYMKTRCPGWCDRVFLTHNARDLVLEDESKKTDYNMMGTNICMGDHKPIYLDIRLRNGQGNKGSMESTLVSVDTPVSPKPPLKKVISINGEMFDANDIENMNIHDYSTFEQEQLLTGRFMSGIRRKTYPQTGFKRELGRQLSFQEVARDVIRAEHVLLAFRHYKHRCDSENEESDDEESRQTSAIDKDKYMNQHYEEDAHQKKNGSPPSSVTGAQVHVTSPSGQLKSSSSMTTVSSRSVTETTNIRNNNFAKNSENQERSHSSYANTQKSSPDMNQNEPDRLMSSSSSLPKNDLPNADINVSKGAQQPSPVDGSDESTGCPCVVL